MANARQEIEKALYVTLNTQTVLAQATGGIWNPLPAQGTKAPYVVFQQMSKVDEHSFDGRYANALYMVKAVSEAPGPKQADDIDTLIDTALEDATLSITGFSHLLCRRESDIAFPEIVAGAVVHHRGGIYRIMADET